MGNGAGLVIRQAAREGEFLDGLRAVLVTEADAKWEVGDYLVTRIQGSTPRGVDPEYHNGAGLVIRQAARDVAYEVSGIPETCLARRGEN